MTSSPPIRSRIAPTPSGYLHLGNMYSFVLTWLMVKSTNGSLLLRIDDLDRQRVRPQYVDDIFRCLDFIGLVPDEGPSGPEEFERSYSQVHRLRFYQQMLNRLNEGGYLFGCICSRSQLQAGGSAEHYPGTCLHRQHRLDVANTAWRLNTETAGTLEIPEVFNTQNKVALHKALPFFVVRKKDGKAAYQVASLCDDELWNINLVVRGADLLASTAAQLYLSKLTGGQRFQHAMFHHHKLIGGQGVEKLSKSAGAYSIQAMRNQGISSSQLLGKIAGMIGLAAGHYESLAQMLPAYCAMPQAGCLNRARLQMVKE